MAVTDEEVLAKYPWGLITHDNKNHWRGFLERKLIINHCLDCSYWIHDPRPMCPKCWSNNVRPEEVSGKGKVHWFSVVHQAPASAGRQISQPLPVITVELAEQEGLRISSTIVNCRNEDLHCDMPVELIWGERNGSPVPVFQPTSGAARQASKNGPSSKP